MSRDVSLTRQRILLFDKEFSQVSSFVLLHNTIQHIHFSRFDKSFHNSKRFLFFCYSKSKAIGSLQSCKASAQSLMLWQRETIETHAIWLFYIGCSRHIHMGAILSVHPVRGASRVQRRADQEVAALISTHARQIHSTVFWKKTSSCRDKV